MRKPFSGIRKLLAFSLCFALFGLSVAFAQHRVTGTVTDSQGAPCAGVTVLVQGTSKVTTTDRDGKFSLDNVLASEKLVFQFIGMVTQEVPVGERSVFTIIMEEDTYSLDELVVTALGVSRSQKAIGYAITEIKGEELLVNTVNPVAALQGKVAGVEISQSDGGMFGSTKILIRGASTLDANNQPIYVIDGVILDNATSSSGDADWASDASDYGNELKSLNPDDFETVTILKGAPATALYGSRGLNGAVVITTKSGKGMRGIGVNISQTFGVDYVYRQPDMQYEYGDGYIPGYISWGERDANGNYYRFDTQQFYVNSDGVREIPGIGMGNGPKFDGEPMKYYDNKMYPYSPIVDNYKNAYNLGFNSNTNFSVQGGNEKTSFYTSLSYNKRSGTLPNNTFERLAYMAKASHQFSKKMSLEASVAFSNSIPRNAQPNLGEYVFNGYFDAMWDPDRYMDKYKGAHGGVASTAYGDEYGGVPGNGLWFSINENDYTQKETNIRPTLTFNYDITDWLSFRAEGNFNYYYRRAESKSLGQGYANEGGGYGMSQYSKEQTNANASFSLKKSFGDFDLNGFVRGEYFNNIQQATSVSTNGGLVVPGQYFIGNSKQTPSYSGSISGTKRIMSAMFQVSASWRDQLFLDITGRNDWTSSLVYTNQSGNYSYFYPSVSVSWLMHETLSLPEWISFAKIRASYAEVGNDTDPYTINQGYSLNTTQYGSNYVYSLSVPNSAYDPSLRPERKKAWELGLDWRLWKGRVALDATFYKENTIDQIMSISVPGVSGISTQLINAGNIQNMGVEVALNTIPVSTRNFEWGLDFTYTRNDNKIISLHENVTNYINLTGSADYGNYRISSVAKVGKEFGLLMTDSAPKRDEQGRMILTYSSGSRTPVIQRSGQFEELGSITPDFLGSLSSSFRYKNWNMRISLDMRFGGYVASYGSRYGTAYGYTKSSLAGRDAEHGGITWTSAWDGHVYYDGIIPQNTVFADGTTITQPDGTRANVGGMSYQEAYDAGYVEPGHATAWNYWCNSWGNGVVNDDWFKELNYIALREVSLGYSLPERVVSKLNMQRLTLGLSGRNLGYLYNTMPSHENPESVRGTSATEFRYRSFSAFTANYMFTINIGF